MSWSEADFRKRCTARAQELGKPIHKLFIEHGLGHDTLNKPTAGRRIDTMERIAKALNWSLPEVMGFGMLGKISLDLSKKAFKSAERVLQYLPAPAQTEDNLIALHAYIYDALAARQRDGRPINDETLAAYEEMLLATWSEKAGPGAV